MVKKTGIMVWAAALAFCLFLSSCGMISRSYLVITPHLDRKADYSDSEGLRADSASSLKTAINTIISEGAEEGKIRFTNYSGDAQKNVRSACLECSMEPLGLYAVEYMTSQCVRILTYYEVTISVTYRRTPEQIASVIQVGNAAEFQKELHSLYTGYGDALTAEVQYFFADQYDIQAMLDARYYSEPVDCLAMPTFTRTLYPDSELDRRHRIIEVTLDYHKDADTLAEMSEALRKEVTRLAASIPNGEGGVLDTIIYLHDLVGSSTSFLPDREDDLGHDIVKDTTFTAYGALMEGSATSEGYALALKALCDRAGIECLVVRGRYDGLSHCWNLVKYGGAWYHADASLGDVQDSYDFFLKTDEQMTQTHKWNAAQYPASAGEAVAVFGEEIEDLDGESVSE